MNKKSTGLLLSILGVLSLVLITAGVTYAFFSYTKEGTTINSIQTGTITFYYDELNDEGNVIKITDALPLSDTDGKALSGNNNVFNFKVTSTVSGNAKIPYTVTARKKEDSTLANDKVKLYLTANETGAVTAGTNYTTSDGTAAGQVKTFSQLLAPTSTQVTLPSGVDERVIFTGEVPANATNYSTDFALRMWINGDDTLNTSTDYSPYEFVLKTVATPTDTTSTTPLKADDLITAGSLIRSTDYYALNETTTTSESGQTVLGRDAYERISHVNMNDRTILTISQVAAGATTAGFEANEQFYQINGQTFTVTVNVYANANVVTG